MNRPLVADVLVAICSLANVRLHRMFRWNKDFVFVSLVLAVFQGKQRKQAVFVCFSSAFAVIHLFFS